MPRSPTNCWATPMHKPVADSGISRLGQLTRQSPLMQQIEGVGRRIDPTIGRVRVDT